MLRISNIVISANFMFQSKARVYFVKYIVPFIVAHRTDVAQRIQGFNVFGATYSRGSIVQTDVTYFVNEKYI